MADWFLEQVKLHGGLIEDPNAPQNKAIWRVEYEAGRILEQWSSKYNLDSNSLGKYYDLL